MPNYRAYARRVARRYGLDPAIFVAQIQQESGFQTGRTSSAGAQGIAQIMPDTARGWGVDPNDPKAALDAAGKHMAQYVKKYGSYRNALVAYNAGPGRVGGPLPAETKAYIATILGNKSGKPTGREGGGGKTTTTTSKLGAAGTAVNVAAALVAQSEKPERPTATAPALPEVLTPKGYRPVQSTGVPSSQEPDLKTALERLTSSEDTLPTITTKTTTSGGGGGAVPAGRSPTGGRGKVIGTPHSGTHTLGNWQSDNAVDISVPEGSAIRSTGTGKVVKVSGGYSGGADRFDGYQVTIETPKGRRFYTHLSKARVKPGQRIKRGQIIGRSGSANGVAHLHFGVERGDPRKFV